MRKKPNSMRKTIYEAEEDHNGLQTRTIISKTLNDLKHGVCAIPRWLAILLGILMVAVLVVLVAAVIIISLAPKPSLHNESCDKKSCEKSESTKCIDGICQCTSDQFFLLKCQPKKSNMESCSSNDQCKSPLSCFEGKCQCHPDYYYSNGACTKRKSYGSTCTGDQCLTSNFLSCNAAGKCMCPVNRFWDGSVCVLKRTYNERCTTASDCDPYKSLLCTNQKCSCEATYMYFNTALDTCDSKLGEFGACSSDIQCLSPMTCVGSTSCQCPTNQYFDAATFTCKPKTLNNTQCTSNNTCRADLGLYCLNNLCQCDLNNKFWNNVQFTCMAPMTYGALGCSANEHCISSQKLFCNIDSTLSQCNCPTNSVNGMCDCLRVIGNESYWDSSSRTCKPAARYGQSCVKGNDKSCQMLTEFTYCDNSGTCALLLDGKSCFNTSECDYYKLLSCVNSQCQCPTDYYWHSSLKTCVFVGGYYASCNGDNECFSNLTCRSSKCICPTAQAFNAATNSCVSCRSGWFGYDDRCYKCYDWNGVQKTWDAAVTDCVSQTAWLAIPANGREVKMIDNACQSDIWVGFQKTGACNQWTQVHLTDTLSSPSWCGGGPSCDTTKTAAYISSGDDCMKADQPSQVQSYICEYKP